MAYAAITSLMTTIKQSMESTGLLTLPLFYEKLESLRSILEKYTGDLEDSTSLEAEIIELACSTEDMVDTVSRKIFLAKNEVTRRMDVWELRSLLKQAVGLIESTMNKWMAIQSTYNSRQNLEAQSFTRANTFRHALEPENVMVGHKNEFELMQDRLARGPIELEVISIVGMGGIGKTTLANKIYRDPFIMSHFDICAIATVSQEYCASNVLLGLLSSISGNADGFYEQDDGQLADQLQKFLKGRRYLVVIDDIWSIEAWEDMKLCFPDCYNGSRVLLTTRNMEVAEYASLSKPPYQMRLMDFDESWSLLYERVSVNGCFSPEFEKIGKQIALNCKGLPLAIVVIAGLLMKVGKSLDEWRSVAKNTTPSVSINLNVQCMRVLALSYHYLPHHLKACFLYFAIFPEDKLIVVSKLVKLWAAEGFLKAEEMKSIEEVADQCLKELIDRSLIFTHHLSFDGNIKACGMHDVIRELCLREARNINFVNINMEDQNPCEQSKHFFTKHPSRISIQSEKSTCAANQLAMDRDNESRSILLFIRNPLSSRIVQELVHFRILRVLDLASLTLDAFPSSVVDLFHLRYLALSVYSSTIDGDIHIPPAIANLQHLQTFILKFPKYSRRQKFPFILPWEIFKMSQLRHLSLDLNYLDYYELGNKCWILRNLQCLSGWNPLFCTSSVFKLFPNIKKLKICGNQEDYIKSNNDKGFHDLCYLDQLEELKFKTMPFNRAQTSIINRSKHLVSPSLGDFPKNLKKIAFTRTHLPWVQLRIVGKLPKLEALKLGYGACIGNEWQVVEEGFPRLKFLLLKYLSSFQCWRASSDHFPCLERLFLKGCMFLDSIPQDFSEITTLELIDISSCAESVGNSAKQIQQDIQDNYASSIEVHIR